ncbi:MAG TPA: DUF2269 family protein [Actinomycetota bacterium]|nr:DUF2269 family protein [Actinomycetota bacterium]
MYDFWLFVHVLMAIVWVGGNIHLQIIGARLVAINDALQIGNFSKQAEWIGTRVLTPAAIVIVVAGVFMTLDRWDFEQLWIIIGLAGFLYSAINGAVFLGPLSGKNAKLIDERGVEDPEVQGNIRKLFTYGRIELVILIVVVWAMTMKPTL